MSTIASSSSQSSYGSIGLDEQLSQLTIQDTPQPSQLTAQTQSTASSQPLSAQNMQPVQFTPSPSESAPSSPETHLSQSSPHTARSTGEIVYPSLPSPSSFFGSSLFQIHGHRDIRQSSPAPGGSHSRSGDPVSGTEATVPSSLEEDLERIREEKNWNWFLEDDTESEDDDGGWWSRG
ncbi:hypothetical protein F5X99DRAFT_57311 [Biscogniauxia marginata]|nr:hypothetical protein F5X99DRAFT_57311 [Biscogniauxia marginata]